MPKLSSRSKHEEFESNSTLQIRDRKEKRAKNVRKEEHKVEEKGKKWNFAGLRKFRNLKNFAACEILQVTKFAAACHCLCLMRTVHPALLNSYCPFEVLPFCSSFDFSPFCPCNS